MDNLVSSQASQNTKMPGGLKLEKPNMSCGDLSSEAVKNVTNISLESSGNYPKQYAERKAVENEGLVRYMSNLPSYLEKGDKLQEKALNVGVLDWRRLEKWQHNHKPTSNQSSRCSASTSNTSFFSTDGSSNRSSRGHGCSPPHQRMRRPTLKSYLTASPKEDYPRGSEAVVEDVGSIQDSKAPSSNPSKGHQSIFTMYQSFSKDHSEIKLKECKREDAAPQIISGIETSLGLKRYGVAARWKGKTKVQDGASTSELEGLQEPCCDVHHNYHQRCKTAVLWGNGSESSHSALSCPCDLATVSDQGPTETSQRSFLEGSIPKESSNAEPYSHVPHSCPLPCEDDNIKNLQIKEPRSVDAKNGNFSSNRSEPSLCSVKLSISPSRGKNLEEKPKVKPRNSTAIKSREVIELKKDTVEASKLRNPSPTRRFINGLAGIVRTSGSKDSAENVAAKSGSGKAVVSSCSEDASRDKPKGASRSQSSPLRRLLDPLLKPKATIVHQLSEPSQKDPVSRDRTRKSSSGRVVSSSVHPVKVKLDLTGCKMVNVDDTHHIKKHESSPVQALLQIAVKNGLPRFTFAVENNSDVLAATMTNPSRKDDDSWIFTFFTVHEVGKKNGWITQGGKGGYIPNVVAQMTVVHENSIKKFALFSVDINQTTQHSTDLHPNDELASIVVKFPNETLTCLNKDGKHGDYINDPSVINIGESQPDGRCYASSRENGSFVRSRDLFSTTVILPGGVHGMPSKGEPAPLFERWKSGGLCDCGGWDLGCRLRVLSNQTSLGRKSSSSTTRHAANRFELFSQVEEDVSDNRPVFSLSPFKDNIFSVEFNSSLSFLQAFSICVALLRSSRKPYELSEFSNLCEEKSSEESAFGGNNGTHNQVQPEVPGSYTTYSLLSPVERV